MALPLVGCCNGRMSGVGQTRSVLILSRHVCFRAASGPTEPGSGDEVTAGQEECVFVAWGSSGAARYRDGAYR
jgi:hypothetical protein